jgi:hypothetical protein
MGTTLLIVLGSLYASIATFAVALTLHEQRVHPHWTVYHAWGIILSIFWPVIIGIVCVSAVIHSRQRRRAFGPVPVA